MTSDGTTRNAATETERLQDLELNKETLQDLSESESEQVQGGGIWELINSVRYGCTGPKK